MSKTYDNTRPLTASERASIRPACIWLDFGEDDDCFLLPAGTMEVDAVVNGKVGKRKVLAFLRVYDGGAAGQYVCPDCLLPHYKVRYWEEKIGDAKAARYVTDKNGDPIGGWEAFYAA
jgi:hypothetical protein